MLTGRSGIGSGCGGDLDAIVIHLNGRTYSKLQGQGLHGALRDAAVIWIVVYKRHVADVDQIGQVERVPQTIR